MHRALCFGRLGKNFAGGAERVYRRRHSGVDRDMHQDFANLFLGNAIAERGADVEFQLMRPI